MKTIKQEFHSYVSSVMNNAPYLIKKQACLNFYAGAISMFNLVMEAADKGKTDKERDALLAGLIQELEQHMNDIETL